MEIGVGEAESRISKSNPSVEESFPIPQKPYVGVKVLGEVKDIKSVVERARNSQYVSSLFILTRALCSSLGQLS